MVCMPEAPVDKDDRAVAREDDVWSAGKVTAVQAEAQSALVNCPTYEEFWLCVLAPNTTHIALALFRT